MSNPQGNLVWVQLRVGEANIGDPCEVDGSGNVSNLKKAVKTTFPNALKHVDAPELKVYGPSSSDRSPLEEEKGIGDSADPPSSYGRLAGNAPIESASYANPFIVQAPPGTLVTEALPPAHQPLQPLAENGELLARSSPIVVLCYVMFCFIFDWRGERSCVVVERKV
jgi:hypothetical protein